MNINDLKVGDKVVTDAGFTCLDADVVCEVQEDEDGLFIECAEGKHHLHGQAGSDGEIVGLRLA